MFLVFNKQYRQESNLISDLVKKIKKSSSLIREYKGNSEIYTLDTIVIEFEMIHNVITVTDRNKNVIVALKCAWAPDELQEARYYMFSNLLNQARETCDKRLEKAKTISQATQKLQTRQAQLDKTAKDKAAAEATIVKARQKLKSL